ncbi:hypothetical protein IWQ61_010492, partial [Dispira simplex]
MARLFWSLVAITVCASTTVSPHLFYTTMSTQSYFRGLDEITYAASGDGGVCGPNQDNNQYPAVAKSEHFCNSKHRIVSQWSRTAPLNEYLDYSQDYLQSGLIYKIKCPEGNDCDEIPDFKFQRFFVSQQHKAGSLKCVPSDVVGVPWLCECKGNFIYAADDSLTYNAKKSFDFLQKA